MFRRAQALNRGAVSICKCPCFVFCIPRFSGLCIVRNRCLSHVVNNLFSGSRVHWQVVPVCLVVRDRALNCLLCSNAICVQCYICPIFIFCAQGISNARRTLALVRTVPCPVLLCMEVCLFPGIDQFAILSCCLFPAIGNRAARIYCSISASPDCYLCFRDSVCNLNPVLILLQIIPCCCWAVLCYGFRQCQCRAGRVRIQCQIFIADLCAQRKLNRCICRPVSCKRLRF